MTPILHLLRPLGEGGMGKVWVARHRGLETDVVVKFLAASGSDRADAEARFAREAAAAAAVKSPHVVQVFDHGITPEGTRYIVMELLDGRDLAMHLAANGPMSPQDAGAVIAQVAKALSRAHQVGIIHRDIKPENIFLCDGDGGEMFVKVLDFGIAKREQQASSHTTTGQVVGTPYYMSPEQLLGERPVDARTDIWSLGVVAFEALTGKRPFDGATIGSITLAVHQSMPTPSSLKPGLPPAIDAWFARACARSPEERFETAREAGQAILNALGDTRTSGMFRAPRMSIADMPDLSLSGGAALQRDIETRATSARTDVAAASPSRKRSVIILGGAVLLVMLFIGGAVATRGRSPSETTQPATSASPSVVAAAPTPSASPAAVVAPATSVVAAAPSAEPAPAATVDTRAANIRPKATARPITRTTRPPRKPNDDDIK